jgi:hypothetical protein
MKSISLFIAIVVLAVPASAWAHGGVGRTPERSDADARLFMADAATGELVAIDLSGAGTVTRLSTPPFIMSLALSTDQRHLFVMRGRSTDRDYITVVNTGAEDAGDGLLRPPYVARTIQVDTPGPGDENNTITIGGKDALLLEGTAEAIVMDDDAFSGFGPIDVRSYKLAAPDHYFYLESGDNLYVGHLRKGYVQVINRASGEEVTKIDGCPLVHGKAMDEASGRLFYACMRDIMVIGSRGDEMNQVVARISYPEKQRVGAFYHGSDGALWAYTEGELPIIYRLATDVEPYTLEVLPLDRSLRQWSTEGGEFLLSLSRGGMLEIRDGNSGEMLRTVAVSSAFEDDYHEHTDKAILPDIKSVGRDAYVSLPHEGRIAVVDLDTGAIERYIDTGGQPTRMVLVNAPRAASQAGVNR